MSGISGIWNLDGKPLSRDLLMRVADSLQHRGPDGTSSWHKDSIGLSANLLRVTPESVNEIQPTVHSSGCVMVFDGRIDNRHELIEQLKESQEANSSTPDSLLALFAYMQWGKPFPARIVGDFALALFDSRSQELLLARDVLGIRPIYYYRDEKIFIFGSEIKAILAHPEVKTNPDERYLAVTMMGGMPPNDLSLTHFENILSLPPSHSLVVAIGCQSQVKYWDFDVNHEIRYRDPKEYVDEFRNHLQQAVRRRLRSSYPVAITVSGGLDSSSIFCIAQKLKQAGELPCPEIVALTHTSEPGTPSDELEFVNAVERDYGVRVQQVPVEFRGLLDGVRPSVKAFEFPLGDLQWYNNASLVEAAKRSGARSMVTGHWGDQILFQHSYLVDLFRRLKWKQVNDHLREFGQWIGADSKWFRRIFLRELVKGHIPPSVRPLFAKLRAKMQKPSKDQPWFTDDFRKLAARSLSRYYPAKGKFPTVHSRSMYEEARAKYYVQAMELHNKAGAAVGMQMELPYLDRDLLWFLMRIPGEVLTPAGVHRGLLRQAMHGILPKEIRERRSKANYTHLENEMMERQYAEVSAFFCDQNQIYGRGYVDESKFRGTLKSLRTQIGSVDGCRTAWSLGDLVGLEIWLQEFFGRNQLN